MNDLEKIHAFLLEVKEALPAMTERERKEVLREAQSHLIDRSEAGRLDEALSAFGRPQDFAAEFGETAARKSEQPRIPTRLVTLRLAAAIIAGVLLVPCLAAVIMEILDPVGFCLWVSGEDGFFVFGKNSSSNPNVSDVASHLMLPVSVLLSVGLAYGMAVSVRSALSQIVSFSED